MKRPFIKLIVAALLTVAAASARTDAATSDIKLNAPVALSLSTAGFPTAAPGGAFAAPTGVFSPGDLRSYALGGAGDFAAASNRTWNAAPATGALANVVPLPEPSSETALYFLSGAVGLALVVMRRRTLA